VSAAPRLISAFLGRTCFQLVQASDARPWAFRAAGNRACRRPFRPFPIRDESLRLRCGMPRTRSRRNKISANCVSGVLDGGLKGRLQARLPATQGGRPHVTNGQSQESSASSTCGRYFCGFVSSGIETPKPEKFVAYRRRRPERPPEGELRSPAPRRVSAPADTSVRATSGANGISVGYLMI